MNAILALKAIQGILAACDDRTQNRVLKALVKPELKAKKKQALITLAEVREDLIKNHFKR